MLDRTTLEGSESGPYKVNWKSCSAPPETLRVYTERDAANAELPSGLLASSIYLIHIFHFN